MKKISRKRKAKTPSRCNLHDAAPQMYLALKQAARIIKAQNNGCCLAIVLDAIKAAEVAK